MAALAWRRVAAAVPRRGLSSSSSSSSSSSTAAAAAAADPYIVLGLTPRADGRDIKRAYYRLSMRYHPDRNPGNVDAHRMFALVTQAYELLGSPQNRARHHEAKQPPRPTASGRPWSTDATSHGPTSAYAQASWTGGQWGDEVHEYYRRQFYEDQQQGGSGGTTSRPRSRFTNTRVLMFVWAVCVVGLTIQYIRIKWTQETVREVVTRRDRQARETLGRVEQRARELTIDEKIQALFDHEQLVLRTRARSGREIE